MVSVAKNSIDFDEKSENLGPAIDFLRKKVHRYPK